MEEKRKLTRVLFHIHAQINKGTQAFIGRVDNVSLKGLHIHMNEGMTELHPGDQVEITIDLTGNSSDLKVQVEGEVLRWEENGAIAVKFSHIDLDSFVHLKNIMAYNSGDYDKIMDEFMDSIQE